MSSSGTTMESRMAASAPNAGNRLPNSVLAMIIFIVMEIMFFAGLVSAHTIARASVLGGVWPPVGQPRLPVERTAINTAILLLSGALLYVANRRSRGSYANALPYLVSAIATGIAFVFLQGVEWVALLREGLTMTSGVHGAFFYLIVGAHAMHAIVAIAVLTAIYFPMRKGSLEPSTFTAVQIFWYFVVLVWPIIYLRVYL